MTKVRARMEIVEIRKARLRREMIEAVPALHEESMWNLRSRREENAPKERTGEEPDIKGNDISSWVKNG
ncbi:hypothetical protein AMTR_s00047p00096880 [Amborella trichopoda]|uniref:Uncharacterized protein n=1 Tax=Amborella trichopoda TaxID=13333 RepID=U5DBH1_AMBTC|nr:hypothetical protein AMTR_s00047p00096880 [Amborella trichopoda]